MKTDIEYMQNIEVKVMALTGITPEEMFWSVYDSGTEFIEKHVGNNLHGNYLKTCPVFWSWYRMKMYQHNQWFLRVMGIELLEGNKERARHFYLTRQMERLEKFSIHQSFHQLVERII